MNYQGSDKYCDVILKGEIPIKKVYESAAVLAFHHTEPTHPVHVVVIPKKHILSLGDINDLSEEESAELIGVLADLSKKITKEYGAARVVTNLGDYQESKHLHFHIISDSNL
jgi:histidine triad (HIT) family protein